MKIFASGNRVLKKWQQKFFRRAKAKALYRVGANQGSA
jgi:hypothetical protein